MSRLKSPAATADGDTDTVDEDEDVSDERRRVLRGSGRRDLLQLKNLTKVDSSTLFVMLIVMVLMMTVSIVNVLNITSHLPFLPIN